MSVALITHRRYIVQNAMRELRARYYGTGLGFFWNVINPLVQIVVYWVVFSRIMPIKMADSNGAGGFIIYLCIGILSWTAFADAVTRGTTAFVDNATYLKKLPIPEEVFVAQAVTASTLCLGINLGMLLLLALGMGVRPAWSWLLLPGVCVLLQALGLGIGLLLGTLNVFFRDIAQMVGVVLQLWMWSLPIVYVADILPPAYANTLPFNPPHAYLLGLRSIIMRGAVPPAWALALMLVWPVLLGALGLLTLHKLRPEIRDVI